MLLVFPISSVGTLWVFSCGERFLFGDLFRSRCSFFFFFFFAIHSAVSFSSKHLFISIASLSLKEGNFLNHYPCMSSWPGVFRFGTFLSFAQSESMCIFTEDPSSSPCNSFFILFIYSDFLWCSLCSHVLLQNCFAFHPVIGMSSCILAGRIFFRCFGMSCFVCIIWSCLDIFCSSYFRQYLLIYFQELFVLIFVLLFISRHNIF